MEIKRIMIAAPKSGSGKTLITCALLQALKDSGYNPVSYKCGPDYIDPMFHETILEIPSANLDTFFTGEEDTRKLFLKNMTEEKFAVIEGVMGLYDGLGGIREEGSSYHLAKVTKTPIILVVDAKGMGKSLIPLIAGFLAYDTEHLIQGVILNRMSKSYYGILKPLAESELDIQVLGHFPEQKGLKIESRHLGLKMPDEIDDLKGQVQRAAVELTRSVSMKKIIQISEKAESFNISLHETEKAEQADEVMNEQPVIAVAKDEAFCFYYKENLAMLQDIGAALCFFSPLHDKKLPEKCHGILLGGGYPELVLEKLSENKSMLSAIRKAIEDGMPTVAECGGFMYLHSAIVDCEGKEWKMVEALPGSCHYTGKLVRFGYIEIEEKESCFLPQGTKIRGHEFHYYDSTDNGEDCLAAKPVSGKTYESVMEGEDHWWGFPHLYYPSNPEFAAKFVEKSRQYMTNKID